FTFKDFGSNSVGSGKRRREIPKTPEQLMIDEIRPIAQLAWKGDVAAKVELAFLILEERYALSNPWRAELSFKEGIAAGVPTAARGYAELLQKWKPATAATTLAGLYRNSAEKGDGASMAWLALNLRAAAGGTQAESERWRDAALAADPKFADRWAKYEILDANLSHAQTGNYAAIIKVLPVLVDGDIRPADWTEALKLADLAAADGQQEPSAYLVNQYQKNYQFVTANSVFEKADYLRLIERGVAASYKPIVALYLENLMTGSFGYVTNQKLALSEAMKLAEQGDADGMFYTAMILANSRGEQKDEAAAMTWLSKAAAAGQVNAQRWMKAQAAKAAPK
ncbi:MAG: sel1 repeat family protein, partial [Opitutaceae bacterium]|nr:sel1 repeat family protein [Opitutaceae bacterium]